MDNAKHIDNYLADIVEIARFAPSVHNTQSWKVRADGNDIEITLDSSHALTDGDPTGRQTVMSLGIFAEAICIAAKSLGLQIKRVNYEDGVARISFEDEIQSKRPTPEVALLRTRFTDRSKYKPVTISKDTAKIFEQANKLQGINVHVVTENSHLKTIAELTAKGIRLALSNPGFRKELSRYLILPWSRKKRGIAVRSLNIFWLLELIEPVVMRLGIGLNGEAKLEKARWLSASAVIIITSKGDMPKYWFEVGRTYLNVSLAIEGAGLSQATSAAIVEASDFHEDVEALLKTTERIQSVIRIGAGTKTRHYSPRLSAREIIIT